MGERLGIMKEAYKNLFGINCYLTGECFACAFGDDKVMDVLCNVKAPVLSPAHKGVC